MFLELAYDLIINSSLSYMYFGLFIMTIGLSQLFILKTYSWHFQTDVNVQHDVYLTVDISQFEASVIWQSFFINWFVKMFKRTGKLDNDDEDGGNSYLKKIAKIRGGQTKLWEKTAYLRLTTEIL